MKTWKAFCAGVGCTLLGVLVGRSHELHDPSAPTGNPRWLLPTELQTPSADSPLARLVGDLELHNATLESAIDQVRAHGKVDIRVDWDTIEKDGGSRGDLVDVALHGASVDTALRILSRSARSSVHYRVDSQRIIVTSSGASLPAVHAIYDLMGPIRRIREHALRVNPQGIQPLPPTPNQGLFSSSQWPVTQTMIETADEVIVDEIIRQIEDEIDSDTWKDNGGTIGSLQCFGGYLFVTQTQDAQWRIRQLLDGLAQ